MPTKLILQEQVIHLGEPGDIVSVAPGYARNYLLPKGLACEMTPANLKQLEHKRKVWAAKQAQDVASAEALAERLGELELSVARKAGETGTLYGAVTNADAAELLAAQGIEIDRRQIVIRDPIKALGEFEIAVKLHHKVSARIRLEVVAEAEDPE